MCASFSSDHLTNGRPPWVMPRHHTPLCMEENLSIFQRWQSGGVRQHLVGRHDQLSMTLLQKMTKLGKIPANFVRNSYEFTSTQRKANAFAVGHVRPSGHPKPAGGGGVQVCTFFLLMQRKRMS